MTKLLRPLLVVLCFPLFLSPCIWAASPGNCSLATLKGTYGSFEQGTVLEDFGFGIAPPYQAQVVGVATYDGAGKVTVNYWANFGGISFPGTSEGTYDVKPDCTYTDEVPSTDSHRTGTITGDGMQQEIHVMFTDYWVVGSGIRKKTPQGNCSMATVQGTYGLFGEGLVPTAFPQIPGAHVGIVTFDGKGHFTGKDTSNLNGAVVPNTFTGTYQVDPDCLVTVEIVNSSFPTLHEAGALTGQGTDQEFHNIITDYGWIFGDNGKKQ